MLDSVRAQVVPALQQRLVLLVNHVLSREPAATSRLAVHAGRRLRIEATGAPPWLPSLPPLALAVTPAGLFEWSEAGDDADLRLTLRADDPSRWLAVAAGSAKPDLAIDGDAALAADVSWLADNLRWDIEADLDRMFGPIVARQIGRLGSSLARGLRALARGPLARQGQTSASAGAEHRAP
jgi:ubiquinone biosynthesis accessory factor UbiJ